MARSWQVLCLLEIFCVITVHFCKGQQQPELDPDDTAVCWTSVDFLGFYTQSTTRCVQGDPDEWLYDAELRENSTFQVKSAGAPFHFNLEFHVASHELVFNELRSNSIRVIPFYANVTGDSYSPPNEEILYDGVSIQINSLTVDWSTDTIYWTDAIYNWISAVGKSRSGQYMRKTIIKNGLETPYGIAVHPKAGWLFWTEYGIDPKIERSWLNGENREVIVRDGLSVPRGITVDYKEDLLYWVDSDLSLIEVAKMNGERVESYELYPHEIPLGIDLYQNWIFITDITDDFIIAINKTNDTDYHAFRPGEYYTYYPWDVAVYSTSRQPEVSTDDCNQLRCEQLCLKTPISATCSCAEGYHKAANGSCVVDPFRRPIFLFAVEYVICACHVTYSHSKNGSADAEVDCFLRADYDIEALAVHPNENILYFSDVGSKNIYRLEIDIPGFEATRIRQRESDGILAAGNTGKVFGIAVNYVDSLLYWTDYEYGHIMVSDLLGKFPQVILNLIDKPRNIELDFPTRTMFWTSPSGIYSATFDGRDKQLLTFLPANNPFGLTMNKRKNWLVWANDTAVGGVGYWDMRSNYTSVIFNDVDDKFTARDLTIYQDHIAWSYGHQNFTFADLSFSSTTGWNADGNKLLMIVDGARSGDIVTLDDVTVTAQSPCNLNNGNCSQLCMPTGNTTVRCLCGPGYTLAGDRKTCSPKIFPDAGNDKFVLVSDAAHKQLHRVAVLDQSQTSTSQAVGGSNFNVPSFVDYDPVSKRVHWVDHDFEDDKYLVKSAELDGSDVRYEIEEIEKPVTMQLHKSKLYMTFQSLPGIGRIENKRIIQTTASMWEWNPQMTSLSKTQERLYWLDIVDSHTTLSYKDLSTGKTSLLAASSTLDYEHYMGMIVAYNELDVFLWNDTTIHRWDTRGHDAVTIYTPEEGDKISSVALLHCNLIIAFSTKRHIYKFSLSGTGQSLTRIPSDPFGSVVHIVTHTSTNNPEDLSCFDYPSTDVPAPNPVPQPSKHHSSSSLSGGAIAGIFVVLALLTVGLVLTGLFLFYKRKKQNAANNDVTVAYETNNAHDNNLYMRFENEPDESLSPQVVPPIPPPDQGLAIATGETPPPYSEKDTVAFGNPLFFHPAFDGDINANKEDLEESMNEAVAAAVSESDVTVLYDKEKFKEDPPAEC